MVTATYTGMQWGGVLAAVVGLWLLRPPDVWRPVYLFGGLTILLLPFLATQLPETAPRLIATGRIGELAKYMKRANPGFNGTDKDEYEVDKGVKTAPIGDVFREGRGLSMIMFIIIYFCTLYMIYGLNLWLPKLMMNAGFSLGSALTFLLVLNLGCFILNIGTAALADWIGPRTVVMISYFLGFFVILACAYKTPTIVIYILVALAGVCTMGAQNIVHAYVATLLPADLALHGLRPVLRHRTFGRRGRPDHRWLPDPDPCQHFR